MYGNADDTATTTTSIHFSVASSGDLAAVADGAGVGGRAGRGGGGGGGGAGGSRGTGENSFISRSELPSSPNLQSRTNVHVASPNAAAAGAGSHAHLLAPKPTRPASSHAPPPPLRAALPPSPRKPVGAAAAAPPQATTSAVAAAAAARAGLTTVVPFQPIRQPETPYKLPASRSYSPNDASLAFMRAVSRLDSEDAQSTSSDGDHNEMSGARVRLEGPHGRAPAPAPPPDRARAAPPTATTATSDDGSVHFEEEDGGGTETAKSPPVSPSPPPRVPAGAAVVKVMPGAAQHPPPLGFKALHPVPPPDKSVPTKLLMKAPPSSPAAAAVIAVPTSHSHATPTQPPAQQGMALVLPTPRVGTSSSAAAAGDAGTSTSPSASQQQQRLPVPRRPSPLSSHNNSMAVTISAATATLGTMGVMGSGGAGASCAPHVASPAATTTATTVPLARLASQGHVRVLSTSQPNEDDPVYCTVSEMTMPNALSLRGGGISAGPSGLSIGQMQSGGGGGGGSAVPSSARLSVSPTVGNHRVMSYDLSFDECNPPSTRAATKTTGAPAAAAAAAAPVLRDGVLSGSPPTTPPVSPKLARGGGVAYRDEDGPGGGAGPGRQALPAGVARPSAVHRTADGRTTAGPGVGPTRPSAAFRPKRPFVFATPPASTSAPAAPAATAAATVHIPAASASDSLAPQRRGSHRDQHPVVGAARGTGASTAASEEEQHTQRPDTPTDAHTTSGVGVSRRPSAASMAGVKAVMCSHSAADVASKAATAHSAESATARRRSSRFEAGAAAAGGEENEVSTHSSRSLRSTRSSFASGLSRFSSMLKRGVSAVVRGGGSGADVTRRRTKASTAAQDAGHEQQDGDGESTSALMPAGVVARDSHTARSLNTTAQLQLQRTLPGQDTVDVNVDIPDRSTSNASVVPAARSAAVAHGDAKGTLTAARSCSQPPKSTSTADGSIRFQTDVEAENDDDGEDGDDELQFVVEESDTPPPVVTAVVPVVAAASAKAAATPGTSSHNAGGTTGGNASISKTRRHRKSEKPTKGTSASSARGGDGGAAGQRADPLHGEGRSRHRRHRSSRHSHRRHKRREASVEEEKAEGEGSSRSTATSRGSSTDSSDTTSVASATTSQAERRRQWRRERERRRRRQQQRQQDPLSQGKARTGREVSGASSAKRPSASTPQRHASALSTPSKSSQLVTPRALFNASAPRHDDTAADTESARQRREYRRALCATGGVSSAHSRLLLRRRQRQRRLYRADAWLAEHDEHHSHDAEDSYDDSYSEGDGDDAAQRRDGKRVGTRRGRSAAATSPPQPSLVAVLAARRRELRAKSRVPSAVDHFAASWHTRQVMRRRLEQAHHRAAQAALARQQQRATALKGLSEESAVHRAVAAAARRSASVPRLASQLPRAASAAASRAGGAQHAAAVAHPSASPRRGSESRLDQYEAALTQELRALDAVVEQRRRRELWTAAGPAGAAAAAQVPAVSRDASRAPAAQPPTSSTAAGPLPSRRRSSTHDAATPPRDHEHAVDRGDSSPAPRTPRTWRSTAGRAAAAAVADDRGGERGRGRGADKRAPTRLRAGVAAAAALVKVSGARPRAAARKATPHASVGRAAAPTASGSMTTTTHEPTAGDTDGHTDAATQRSAPPDRRAAVAPHLTLEALQRKYELLLEEFVLDAVAGPSTIAVEDRDASGGHTKGVSGTWAVSPGSISGGSSIILRAAPAADAVAQGTARCAAALRAEYYRTSATPAAAALPHVTALSPSAAAAVMASYVQALRPSCAGCRPQELEDYMTLSLLSMLHGPVQHRISGGVPVPAPRCDQQARPSGSLGTLVQRHIREELYAPPPPRLRNGRQPNVQAHVAAEKDSGSGSASASTAAAEARTTNGGDGTPTGVRSRSPQSPQPRADAPPQPFTPPPTRVCAMLQARVVKEERRARHACALAEAAAAQALYRLYLVETVLALRAAAAAAASAQHTADAAPRQRPVSEDRQHQPLQLHSAEADAVDGGDAHAHHKPATPAMPRTSSFEAAAAAAFSSRVREASSSASAPPFAPVGRHARHGSVGALSLSSGAWLVPASSVPSKQERRGVESHGGGSSGASAFTGDVAASSQPGSDLDWTSLQHSALASAVSYDAVCANTTSASVSAAAGVETAAGSPVRRRPTPPHLPLPVALPDEETLLLPTAKPAAAAAAAATTEDGSVTAMGSPLLLASAETTPSPSQAPDSFFNATRSRTSGSPGDGGGRAVATGMDDEDDMDAAMLLRLTLSAVASPVEGQAAKAQAEGALAAMVRSVDLPPSARDSKDSLAASSDVVFVLENPSQVLAPCGVAAVAAAGFAPPPATSASNTSLALEIEDVGDAGVGAGRSDGKSEADHAERPVEVETGAEAAAAAASTDVEAMHTARSSSSTSAPPAPVDLSTPEAPEEWRKTGAVAAASSSTELDAHTHAPQAPPSLTTPQHAQGLVDSARSTVPSSPIPQAVPTATQQAQQQQPAADQQLAGTAGAQGSASTLSLEIEDDSDAAAGLANGGDAGRAEADAGGVAHEDSVAEVAGAGAAASDATAAAAATNNGAALPGDGDASTSAQAVAASSSLPVLPAAVRVDTSAFMGAERGANAAPGGPLEFASTSSSTSSDHAEITSPMKKISVSTTTTEATTAAPPPRPLAATGDTPDHLEPSSTTTAAGDEGARPLSIDRGEHLVDSGSQESRSSSSGGGVVEGARDEDERGARADEQHQHQHQHQHQQPSEVEMQSVATPRRPAPPLPTSPSSSSSSSGSLESLIVHVTAAAAAPVDVEEVPEDARVGPGDAPVDSSLNAAESGVAAAVAQAHATNARDEDAGATATPPTAAVSEEVAAALAVTPAGSADEATAQAGVRTAPPLSSPPSAVADAVARGAAADTRRVRFSLPPVAAEDGAGGNDKYVSDSVGRAAAESAVHDDAVRSSEPPVTDSHAPPAPVRPHEGGDCAARADDEEKAEHPGRRISTEDVAVDMLDRLTQLDALLLYKFPTYFTTGTDEDGLPGAVMRRDEWAAAASASNAQAQRWRQPSPPSSAGVATPVEAPRWTAEKRGGPPSSASPPPGRAPHVHDPCDDDDDGQGDGHAERTPPAPSTTAATPAAAAASRVNARWSVPIRNELTPPKLPAESLGTQLRRKYGIPQPRRASLLATPGPAAAMTVGGVRPPTRGSLADTSSLTAAVPVRAGVLSSTAGGHPAASRQTRTQAPLTADGSLYAAPQASRQHHGRTPPLQPAVGGALPHANSIPAVWTAQGDRGDDGGGGGAGGGVHLGRPCTLDVSAILAVPTPSVSSVATVPRSTSDSGSSPLDEPPRAQAGDVTREGIDVPPLEQHTSAWF